MTKKIVALILAAFASSLHAQGYPEQADPRGHRLRAGRIGGRRHPAARAGARAAARPADHHREQARQRRRRGDGVHRQGADRRLHAVLLRQRPAHGRAAPVQGRLRHPQVVHASRPRLRQRQPAGGASVDAVQERGRRGRALEARAGQVELRHLGRRRAAPPVGRIFQERHRRAAAAHSLQGRRTGDDRPDGRPGADAVLLARARRWARSRAARSARSR